MATYLIISLNGSKDAVDAAVKANMSKDDVYEIEPGKWLVSSDGITSKDVSSSLQLSAAQTHLVVPVKGYFGFARPEVWEWLAAKAPVNA